MTAIDCSDCYLAIAVGDGIKRALVRHFRSFIAQGLVSRGVAADSERAAERIDDDAWRLAARAITEVENEVEDTLDESLLAPDPNEAAQTVVARVVAMSVTALERQYRQDGLFGLDALVAALGVAATTSES